MDAISWLGLTSAAGGIVIGIVMPARARSRLERLGWAGVGLAGVLNAFIVAGYASGGWEREVLKPLTYTAFFLGGAGLLTAVMALRRQHR